MAPHPLIFVLCCLGATAAGAQDGASATSTVRDTAAKHLYADQYDLAGNLWGIRGAGDQWQATIFTRSSASMAGAGYAWAGFDGSVTAVKAYPSIRYGASNRHNDPARSNLPYRFGTNDRAVVVAWDFTAQVTGKYNHTLDVFFNASPSTRQAEIRGEIMVITDSSQDAQTAGWGRRDTVPFVAGGVTWDVWQATQTSNGYRWHVTQFRRRVNAQSFHHNLQGFFAEAAARRPDVFQPGYFVMMVEAGTEIKTGAGRVTHTGFTVQVRPDAVPESR